MLISSEKKNQAELQYLTQLSVDTLQLVIQELLNANMVQMISSPIGDSYQSEYKLGEQTAEYLVIKRFGLTEDAERIRSRVQQLVQTGELSRGPLRFVLDTIHLRNPADRFTAIQLRAALAASKSGDYPRARLQADDALSLAPDYSNTHR